MSRCPGCLEEKGNSVVCPRCQQDEQKTSDYPLSLPPGTILNQHYWLGLPLGQGGFGITYRAWDMALACKVAIKEYLPTSTAERREDGHVQSTCAEIFQHGLGRFQEEAQALAQFPEEPGIIPVRTWFTERGTGYFVMPYLPGTTLKQWVKQRGTALSLNEALNLLQPIFTALARVHGTRVHDATMIHRDISPDNIYLVDMADRQEAKLIDFGAARYVVGTETQTLTTILKPGFAPPEQYRSRGRQGPWTDVYALAATLYWAITGQIPAEAMDRETAVRQGSKDPLQSPTRLGVMLPKSAETVLLKALHIQWKDRYQDVTTFQRALFTTLPSEHDAEARPEPSRLLSSGLRNRLLSPVLVGVYIAIAVTVLFYLRLGWLQSVPDAMFWSLAGGLPAGIIGWWVNRQSQQKEKKEKEKEKEKEKGVVRSNPEPGASSWVLVCTHGELAGRGVPITPDGLIIGRDPQHAHVILTNPQISGRHARIWLSSAGTSQTVILEDLNSTNGTYVLVSSNPTRHWEPLRPHQPFTLGSPTTTFSVGRPETVCFQIENH